MRELSAQPSAFSSPSHPEKNAKAQKAAKTQVNERIGNLLRLCSLGVFAFSLGGWWELEDLPHAGGRTLPACSNFTARWPVVQAMHAGALLMTFSWNVSTGR